MTRTSVSSSNIASIGYDSSSQILEVEFLKGGVYQYSGVSVSTYNALMSASSHGEYFDANIKKGGYSYKKVS